MTIYNPTQTDPLMTSTIQANSSAGVSIKNLSGNSVALFGAGDGLGTTFYDGVNITGNLTVDTNVLYVNTTTDRVGLLTSNPTRTLDIGNATANYPVLGMYTDLYGGHIETRKNGGTYGILYLQPESGDARIYYNSVDSRLSIYNSSAISSVYLTANGTSYLNGGNVGIGTTTPSSALNVVGVTSLQSGAGDGVLRIGADVGVTTLTTDVRKLGRVTAPSFSNAYYYSLFSADSNGGTDGIEFGGRPGAVNPSPTYISFATTPTQGSAAGNAERMRITASGNTGIGTINPTSQLQIYSATTQSVRDGFTDLRLEHLNASGASGATGAMLTFAQPYLTGDTAMIRTGAVRGIKTEISGNYGGGLQLMYQPTSNVDMLAGLTLTHAGNVGIGTTTPTSKLTVMQPADGNGIRVYGYDDKATSWLEMSLNGNGLPVFDTSASVFYFNKSLGITDNISLTMGSWSGAGMRLGSGGNDAVQLYTSAGGTGGGSANSGYINIMNSSGINNANRHPADSVSNVTLRIYSSDDTQADDYIQLSHNQTDAVIGWGNGNLLLSGSGNVGIGNTAPSTPLDVTGVIRSSTYVMAGTGYGFKNTGRGGFIMSSDGVMTLVNNSENGFTRLNLGLNTSSFPALINNSSNLKITRGDGTTACSVEVTGVLNVGSGVTSTGIQEIIKATTNATATVNNGSKINFYANRTTGGLTNIAGITGKITDIGNSTYGGELIFSSAYNGALVESGRIRNGYELNIGNSSVTSSNISVESASSNGTFALEAGHFYINEGGLMWNGGDVRIAGYNWDTANFTYFGGMLYGSGGEIRHAGITILEDELYLSQPVVTEVVIADSTIEISVNGNSYKLLAKAI